MSANKLDPCCKLPLGFFFDGISDVKAAVDSYLVDSGNYAAYMYCYPVLNPGPEVIKLFSCSTQLSMKF